MAVIGDLDAWRISDIVDWRDDGGIIEIKNMKVDASPINLEMNGTVSLDQELKPIGAGTVLVYGAEEGMPQLNTEFWIAQTFWLALIFSTLYIVIWKIFLPKITDVIENRKMKVVNDLNQAEKFKKRAQRSEILKTH